MKKVIVLGLDGFEPAIAEAMQQRGELPNLSRVAADGGYSRVQTTYPAQTPVAWSTFSTGTNPGGHGIFDFLSRDPETYLPRLGLSTYEQKNPFLPPQVVNLRRGVPFWQLLTEAGVDATVIRCACTYPPDELQGRMLSGVGVPDLRGGLGTSTFYTTRAGVQAESSEKVVSLDRGAGGDVRTHIVGPRNPKTRQDITLQVKLQPIPHENKVLLHSDGHPAQLELSVGHWSDWLKVRFKLGLLQSVRGMVRFFLRGIEPELELYASPVNFDPQGPLFPISSPPEYAQELEDRLGTYYTAGMAEDHDGLINLRFDESAYLDQCNRVLREREQMLHLELERFDRGLLFCLFDTPDRLQHIFWRFREPDHPSNRQHGYSAEMGQVIEDHYRECDAIVGRALSAADEHTLFIVLSDHGMNTFQRGLNLNTWLHDNGFLALRDGMTPSDNPRDFLRDVDWERTQAYTFGLGGVYLNQKGREAEGVVEAGAAAGISASIQERLLALQDPVRQGQPVIRSVVRREEVYMGPYAGESPDLVVNFAPGYRVSWGTPLGGIPAGLFEDNLKKWGGDHVIDPQLVPGVLYMNQPFSPNGELPRLSDLAPTILSALGVPAGAQMEGKDLLA